MAEHDPVYVIDTSSWLQIEQHPASNMILDCLARLINMGRVKAPTQVFDELKSIDNLAGWLVINRQDIEVNRNQDIDFLMTVGRVTHQFPAMAGARTSKDKADPYVIALAIEGSPNPGRWTVICNETLDRRPNRKIPTACAHFGIDCIDIIEMLRREFPFDDWD